MLESIGIYELNNKIGKTFDICKDGIHELDTHESIKIISDNIFNFIH